MTAATNTTAGLAEWAAQLGSEDIPPRILEGGKSQILSVIASVHAGHFSDVGRTVSKTVKEWGGSKEATLIPSGEKTSLHYAIFGNAALSMALDYGDYWLAGHSASAAVVCGLALAEKHSVTGKDFLAAQTAANEVAARLGAAVSPAIADGQLWSFVHLAAGAIAGARLLGLDSSQTAAALGLAISQPSRTLAAGFFGSDARALVAAQAAPAGVIAAQLAGNGLRGPREIIKGEQGFLSAFTPEPVGQAFRELGKVWLIDAVSFKMYPAGAHLSAMLDAILQLARSHSIDPKKVRSIDITAGPLAIEMENLAATHLQGPESATATLNHSARYTVAVALIDKELSPRQFLRERVKDTAVWDLASKVVLNRDEAATARACDQHLLKRVSASGEDHFELNLSTAPLDTYQPLAGASVKIEMQDGRAFEHQEHVPQGTAARTPEERRRAVEEKFRRETRYTLRKEKMERAIDLVENLERAAAPQVRELVRLCCSERA